MCTEIIKANTIKRVTFEYGSTVEPIQNLIEKVKVIRERFYCEVFPDKCWYGKEIVIVQSNPHAIYSLHLFVKKWGWGKKNKYLVYRY